MGSIEINSAGTTCKRCGMSYGRMKGNFPIVYAPLYKGSGHLPYCRSCVDSIFSDYLKECNDERKALRQTCRKLDLYYNDRICEAVVSQSSTRSIMTVYIQKIGNNANVGKCYDDTLKEEGTLWVWGRERFQEVPPPISEKPAEISRTVPDEVVEFWGPGYSADMYDSLEQRRNIWVTKLGGGELDIGTEAIVRQICCLEIDINILRNEGKSAEKLQNTLNTMIGSLNLKPNQKKEDADASVNNTPLGVWIWRWENKRPIPEPDPELQDVDGVVRYILTWFYGHLAKMLNIKNAHSALYEKEIENLRVVKPEFDDEDDETFISDIFADNESSGQHEGGDRAERE